MLAILPDHVIHFGSRTACPVLDAEPVARKETNRDPEFGRSQASIMVNAEIGLLAVFIYGNHALRDV